ncbi:hypothetical protein BO70DRAFT_79813 [Aspergillus heteromorphus CBS 117.55]|uniref:Uncharacterized protein n=1 Tax=Aspergillus heteromorphus CBS 117.55 TaxID=1448321 RepID=A0A317WWT1_9EURO|nr:uncharacterized protein BO70DRAFT_79813 [Aspergillus heteromorphus CBS 117.55]PWY90839.1 hypothetical protein BO70DRAFT_79813 [Aspergillus heteromorphus CBS 117.55]
MSSQFACFGENSGVMIPICHIILDFIFIRLQERRWTRPTHPANPDPDRRLVYASHRVRGGESEKKLQRLPPSALARWNYHTSHTPRHPLDVASPGSIGLSCPSTFVYIEARGPVLQAEVHTLMDPQNPYPHSFFLFLFYPILSSFRPFFLCCAFISVKVTWSVILKFAWIALKDRLVGCCCHGRITQHVILLMMEPAVLIVRDAIVDVLRWA